MYVGFFAVITAYVQLVAKEYMLITQIGVVFGIISFIGVVCFLDESPLYLLRTGEEEKAEKIIRRIYKVNKATGNTPKEVKLDLNERGTSIQNPILNHVDNVLAEANFSTDEKYGQMENPGNMCSQMFSSCRTALNLMLLIYMWSAIQFTYYQFNFTLRFLPGNIFTNAFASAASEIIGAVFGGLWYRVTGISIALVLSFGLSAAGGICIMEYGSAMPTFMPLLVCMARTGIASAFNIVYYGN